MNQHDAMDYLRTCGPVLHETEHALAVRTGGGTGPVLLAIMTAAHGGDWIELRVWAGAGAGAAPVAVLARNAMLAHGSFCLIDGELYVRAALALDTLAPRDLERAVAGLVAEAELMWELEHESTATGVLFGYLA